MDTNKNDFFIGVARWYYWSVDNMYFFICLQE